ncbi:peptidyl-prolyl cis-trans isomerase-like 1 [Zalerion maritima]|uniref:Peptidyl-prolyl cis-trans isomerase n=1 Tax=Zalerion maritima TaxID=339359 RepID=A0AAD5WTY1_9PEZI|nr:peptidyl-prolyl cis-trans isomerase-like 1 [Zalerion maritima]
MPEDLSFQTRPASPGRSAGALQTSVGFAGSSIQLASIGQHIQCSDDDGTITLELYTSDAPKTCENFLVLSQRGYFTDNPFHRIIPNFMIQTGDPTGTGRGGTSIYGDKYEDEISPVLKHVGAGVLSMANSGPNTNGSQFFITLAPTPWLDGKHTIFGRVKSGMGVVKRMGLVKTGPEDRPVEEVKIMRARIVEDEDI